MKVRFIVLAAGAAVAFAIGACSGPTQPIATSATVFDTGGLYALSDAPVSGPTAIATLVLLGGNLYGPLAVRAVPGVDFNVAFDINGATAIAMPTHAVMFSPVFFGAIEEETTLPFDSMLTAPTVGYTDSLTLTLHPGSRFYVQSFTSNPACAAQQTTARHYIYSKIIIDSINYTPWDAVTAPSGHTLYYRLVVDPNCGFLGLGPGFPKE